MGTTQYTDSPTGEARRDSKYAVAEVVEIPGKWTKVNTPWLLVQDRFETTSGYAKTSFDATQDYIDKVLQLTRELEIFQIPDIDVEPVDVPSIKIDRPGIGELPIYDEDWPSNSARRPTIIDVPDVHVPDLPIFNIPDPSYRQPDKPDEREVIAPGGPPTLRQIIIPPRPTLDPVEKPELYDITIPPAPEITLPEFQPDTIDDVIYEPQGLEWSESPFNSPIWKQLLERMLDSIMYGGKGLSQDIEQQYWDRAIIRQQVENQKAYEEIENYHSLKGWDMPQGALAASLQEKSDEIGRNRQLLNMDIATKQAELAHEEDHFMLQLGKESETLLRDFHDKQMNRGLELAKAIAANSIEILNAKVAQYNAKVEKYKADAQVFVERVRAASIQVEIFKSQVEAAKVSAEVQQNLIDIYKTEVEALLTAVELYKAQVEGAKTEAEIEGLKIENFARRVEAYVSEVEAEKTKWEAYGIEVEAEKAGIEMYTERVKAFSEQIKAKALVVEAEDKVATAKINQNNAEIERYKAELEAYQTEIDAMAKRVAAVVDAYRGKVDAYSAETAGLTAYYGAISEEIKAKVMVGKFNLDKAIAEIEAKTLAYTSMKKLQMEGVTSVMNVGAQLSASAMNAVSATASYGYSGSDSINTSFSYGVSNSERHSFNHQVSQYVP